MEAKLVSELQTGPGWPFEPKWDGFRCLAASRGIALSCAVNPENRSRDISLKCGSLCRSKTKSGHSRGELIIEINDKLSFNALQMHTHAIQAGLPVLDSSDRTGR
jgi:hypothetical protein